MTQTAYVECVAVPDGIVVDSGVTKLRLSLVLRPVPADDGGGVSLLDWPSEIAGLEWDVSVGPDRDNLSPLVPIPAPAFDAPVDTGAAALDWWRNKLWRYPKILSAYAALMRKVPQAPALVESYSYAQIAEIARGEAEAGIETALASAAMRGERVGIAPAADLTELRRRDPNAPEVQVRDALDILNRDVFAGMPVGDKFDAVRAQADSAAVETGLGAAPSNAQREAALQRQFALLRRAVDSAADPARVTETRSWSPFLASSKSRLEGAVARSTFDAPLNTAIYGEPVATPACTATAALMQAAAPPAAPPAPSKSALGMGAFERAMKTDLELGADPVATVTLPNGAAPDDRAITDAQANEIAARNLAALQAHPALRKFARLIVDLEFPAADLPQALRSAGKGLIAVEARGGKGTMYVSLTAFQYRDGDAASGLFEPCPQRIFDSSSDAGAVPSLPLHEGVVMLNTPRRHEGDADARFRIETVDAIAGVMAKRRSIQATVGATLRGASPESAPTGDSGLRTRGLMLLDTEAFAPAHVAEQRAAAPAPDPGDKKTLYAEDLIEGYRIDVVSPKGRLYPIGARSLRYDVIEAAVAGAAAGFGSPAGRDEGYVMPSSRTWVADVEGENGVVAKRRMLMVSEVLTCWDGSSLGIPTPWRLGPPSDANPLAHLPAVVTYDFPAGQLNPILRTGEAYRFLLRARKLNGSSVSREAAQRHVAQHALGDSDGKPFVFAPVERAPAPVVLVPDGERLIKVPGDDEPTSQTILLDPGAPPAVRWLVSPRIGFEIAEWQGQFDPSTTPGGITADADAAALQRLRFGAYRWLVHTPGGDFPSADGADARLALKFAWRAPPTSPPPAPHYVDATVCTLGTRLRHTKATPPTAVETATVDGEIAFWKRSTTDRRTRRQGFSPDRVVPIKLIIKTALSGRSRVEKLADWEQPLPGGQKISGPTIQVVVAPADTLSLDVWTNRTAEAALAQPTTRRALAIAQARAAGAKSEAGHLKPAFGGDLAAREEWWATQCGATRIGPLSDVVTFRIEHIRARPISGRLAFGPLECVHRKDAASWRRVANQTTQEDEPNAGAIFSSGSIRIDRRSMGAVWAECFWMNRSGRDTVHRTSAAEDFWEIDQVGLWAHSPKPLRRRLFSIDRIPELAVRPAETGAEFAKRFDRIDLVRDDNDPTKLRELAADFKCDTSRRLLVRLVAKSRFAQPSARIEDSIDWSASEQACFDLVQSDAWSRWWPKGVPDDSALPAGVKVITLKATRPPAPPSITRDKGTMYQRRLGAPFGKVAAPHKPISLRHVYRCWLDADWFDSGESEVLAVVCRHADETGRADWLVSQLSRWGGDMTMRPSQPLKVEGVDLRDSTYLDPTQIADALGVRNEVIFRSGDGTTDGERANVSLALLEPKFHDGVGRWYCDIGITPTAAFKVGVQLHLARYQVNAIAGCKLSRTVRADAFMLHQPWTFSAALRSGMVEVVAMGPAYVERAPMSLGLDGMTNATATAGPAAEPLIVAELERLGDGGEPLPVLNDIGGIVLARSDTGAQTALGYGADPDDDIPRGWKRWTMRMAIPAEEVGTKLAVRISLASAHANSRAARAPASGETMHDGPMIYLPEPLTVQIAL